MTQALPSSYMVPVLQIVAGVAVLQIFTGNTAPLYNFINEKVPALTDELFIAGKNILHDSPVIAITAGAAYLGQLCDQKYVVTRYPAWSMDPLGESPLKVALYVAGILALRSALSTYLQRVMNGRDRDARDDDKTVRDVRAALVRNIVPIAIGCAAAYHTGVPVKLAQTAFFTAALIPVVKLVGNVFEYLTSVEIINAAFKNVLGWMK